MATAKLVTAEGYTQSGVAASAPVRGFDTSTVNNVVGGSIDDVRGEIDDAFADMRTFHNLEPDECMRLAGGHSARMSEIRVRIQRVEDFNREWKNVRTREIEPTLEELDRQYTIASRLLTARELDYKLEAGER